jgi:hypothetical protein
MQEVASHQSFSDFNKEFYLSNLMDKNSLNEKLQNWLTRSVVYPKVGPSFSFNMSVWILGNPVSLKLL